ncbi:MAG: fdrA domain protein [Candidatus Thorarchaeota archaeon]
MNKKSNLLSKTLRVINVGIQTFAEDLRSQDIEVVHVEWQPPAGGDSKLLELLDKLYDKS